MSTLTLGGIPVKLQDFKGKTFTLHGFELSCVLWFLLEEVASILQVSTEDVKELLVDEPEDFATLSDGRVVIKESGLYYLALFVSDTPAAKEFQDWVFGAVIPSIVHNGYYMEEVREHDGT